VRRDLLHAAALAVGALLIPLVFSQGGADRWLADLFFDPVRRVFPLRDDWWLSVPGHTSLKWVALGFWLACVAWGGRLRRGAFYMAAIVAVVLAVKHNSPYSCPSDLPEYGGSKPDAGRCLPAAHPLTGFALFGLYLALRGSSRREALSALAAAWIVGLAAGAIQMARGAHFASHVLWTAWVAWAVTLLLAALERPRP
jgi:membrane-associated PAP2 superfamily phosphatase